MNLPILRPAGVERPPAHAREPAAEPDAMPSQPGPAPEVLHRWQWALVPLLATVAYATVARIGFLQDDFVWLRDAHGLKLADFLPQPNPAGWLFYRPISYVITWKLGWAVWGLNPLPYHLMGLLVHAGVAVALGLWLAEATLRPRLGWLAGALFAVFPLNLEALGWVSDQWDLWAAFFGLLSLWLFTAWWRRISDETGARWPYAVSLLCYTLGIFSKESIFTFLPVFAASAWLVTPYLRWRSLLRLGLSLIPFGAVLAANLIIRLVAWGSVGGYPNVRHDYANFVWDSLITIARMFLAPINQLLFGVAAAQVVGAATSIALLLGLVWYGYLQRRVLTVAALWLLLALLPVVNLPLSNVNLAYNRFFYLATAGYCVGVAALLYGALSAGHWRVWIEGLVGLLLLGGVSLCWVQLGPWHTATVQAEEITRQAADLIPAQPRPHGMVFYVKDLPFFYQGAPLFFIGLGEAYHFAAGDIIPGIETVQQTSDAPLTSEERDIFVLAYRFSHSQELFHISSIAGITAAEQPPAQTAGSSDLSVWDFRSCRPDTVGGWQTVGTGANCQPGEGLVLQPVGGDPQIISPPVSVHPDVQDSTQFVRLRIAIRYPRYPQSQSFLGQWFWKAHNTQFSKEHRVDLQIKQDGATHVYWTYLPSASVGKEISQLRFDPINYPMGSTLQWIAVDLVH